MRSQNFNRIIKLWKFICKSAPESRFSSIDVFKNFLNEL